MGNKQNKNENKHFNEIMHIKSMNELKKDKNSENKDKDRYKFNILFIGESGIGAKTSLIKRLIEGKFIELKDQEKEYENCGYLFFEKENKKIILYLIDTNSKKEMRNFVNDYFQNADCIIIGYDVTNKQSFQEAIDYWYKKVQELSNTNLIYLLGNKIDLKFEIVENKGKSFSDLNNLKFFPISVKNGSNIQNFINDLKYNLENNVKNDINNGINEIILWNSIKRNL
jgi:Ras-related protein Rab-1A